MKSSVNSYTSTVRNRLIKAELQFNLSKSRLCKKQLNILSEVKAQLNSYQSGDSLPYSYKSTTYNLVDLNSVNRLIFNLNKEF